MTAFTHLPAAAATALVMLVANSGLPAVAQTQADIVEAFQDADKNHDGKLDAAEFATLPDAIRAEAVDANHDGFYTLAELTPSAPQPSSKPSIGTTALLKAFQAADKNHDGRLDAAEFQTLPPMIREAAVDSDKDGFYTLGELARGMAVLTPVDCGYWHDPSPTYRLWSARPTDLSPGEVVLRVDPRTSRRASRTDPLEDSETLYDVKDVLVGPFAGKTVIVSSQASMCGFHTDGPPKADVLVGPLYTAEDGTPILLARPTPPGSVP